MSPVYPAGAAGEASLSRPIVKGLFAASCILAIVSWYTTQQGMALYLSTWFSFLASLGIQSALVLVAWLTGVSRTRRAILVSAYAITALVSIAFSYSSLYTWFSARERPAEIQRQLYDRLSEATGRAEEMVVAAVAEGQKHVLALEEMTSAEKAHGYISRAADADPYLARIREAVAEEARTYSTGYREGTGAGLRYTAFERYGRLTRQAVDRMEEARRALAELRGRLQPLDPTDKQLREFRQAYDGVPWAEVERTLHGPRFERPAVPAYTEFVDRSASKQEDLLVAFEELVTKPGSRNVFAFVLAAFIDIVIFLLAYASGPYFFGSPEERWVRAAAAIDGIDPQLFTREFLRKLDPGTRAMARVETAKLSPGERQLCLLLEGRGLASPVEEEGGPSYLLDPEVHERLVETLSSPGMPLRAQKPAFGA